MSAPAPPLPPVRLLVPALLFYALFKARLISRARLFRWVDWLVYGRR